MIRGCFETGAYNTTAHDVKGCVPLPPAFRDSFFGTRSILPFKTPVDLFLEHAACHATLQSFLKPFGACRTGPFVRFGSELGSLCKRHGGLEIMNMANTMHGVRSV